ncbi:hypothetical protein H0H10_08930 [Streptomyces sp. TRM S81-3]|uniref:Lipoprotein n=1 Tax=Streptomyces griseicoloratus TaxID=2752516 RepID=A0A926KYP1_9ACTN|nr:hypothetical protein [Streptomyces griseicoloratus]MBD0419295.1 hypothetical protein [Streptomyces griseicoloratus]
MRISQSIANVTRTRESVMKRVVAAIAVAASVLVASGCSSSPEAAEPESTTAPWEAAAPAQDDGADVSDGLGQYEAEVDADVAIVDVRASDSDPNYAMAVVKVKNRGEECPVGAVTALFYDKQGTFYTEGVNHFMELGKGDTVTVNVEAIRMGNAKRAEVVEVSCQ